MKYLRRLVFLAVVPLFVTNCNIDNFLESDANTATNDCDRVICALVFISVHVTIVDSNQVPVALDDFQILNTETGEDITPELLDTEIVDAQETGKYPIVRDDSGIQPQQELQVTFRGFIGGNEVVSSNYTVSADCCHVRLVSGDTELEL